MASVINLKRRIKTAKNITKLTRALEMVAVSKLRRGKEGALKARPYADKLFFITSSLKRIDQEEAHPFFLKKEGGKILYIVFSPDRALCGALISNLTREFFSITSGGKTAALVTVGRKFAQRIVKTGLTIVADFPFGTSFPAFDTVLQIRSLIVDEFLRKEVSEVFCLYTKFENVFSQKPQMIKLLPIEFPSVAQKENLPYLFEPDATDVLTSLLPHYLEMQLFQMFIESYASEQASRMNSMHNATENAKEVVEVLTLEYNKVRQERVTNEILDIVTASMSIGL